MQEDGSYKPCDSPFERGVDPFDIQNKFFKVTLKEVMKAKLFEQEVQMLAPEEVQA
jgi:hypothetical protein